MKLRRVMACVSIFLIIMSMILFARVLAYNTALINYEQQQNSIVINVDSEISGDINVNINSQNNGTADKPTLINDLIVATVEFLLTVLATIITTRYSLTGKIIGRTSKETTKHE